MQAQEIFNWFFGLNFIAAMLIRAVYSRKHKEDELEAARVEGRLMWFFMFLWAMGMMLPIVTVYSDSLEFANLSYPVWLGWVGAALFTFGNWMLWRTHVMLGRNWSATLEITTDHKLITQGVYKYIRHPMYTAHFLIALGIVALIPNGLAAFVPFVAILGIYFLRVQSEEEMMLEKFGAEYQTYMESTGSLTPWF